MGKCERGVGRTARCRLVVRYRTCVCTDNSAKDSNDRICDLTVMNFLSRLTQPVLTFTSDDRVQCQEEVSELLHDESVKTLKGTNVWL